MSDLNKLIIPDESTLSTLQNTINTIILQAQHYKKYAKKQSDGIEATKLNEEADFLINSVEKLQKVQKKLINSRSLSEYKKALEELKELGSKELSVSPITAASSSLFFKTPIVSISALEKSNVEKNPETSPAQSSPVCS